MKSTNHVRPLSLVGLRGLGVKASKEYTSLSKLVLLLAVDVVYVLVLLPQE